MPAKAPARHRPKHPPAMKLRGSVWWLKLTIPRPLRGEYISAAGKPRTHIEESLGTGDRREAMRRRDIRVAQLKAEFRAKERRSSAAMDARSLEAARWREAIRNADPFSPEEGEDSERDLLLSLLVDEAEEIEQREGIEAAKRFFDEATDIEGKFARRAFEAWMEESEGEIREGTRLKYRLAFNELINFLGGQDLPLDRITRKEAQRYVDWLNKEAKSAKGGGPLSERTKRDRVQALGSFWKDWVLRRGLTVSRVNPWHGLKITGKRRPGDNEGKKRPFTDDEILRLINGPELPQGKRTVHTKRTLTELLALGLYTGARLEELCARKLGDLAPKDYGYDFSITEAKSEAGIRTIPITHPIPVAILRRRIGKRTDPEAQLWEGLSPGGPDRKYSAAVQKALGRYRDRVGLPSEADFHSTRRSFATRLLNKGVAGVARDRYFGHKSEALADNTYAGETPQLLLKVAQAISYPEEIEEALRRELGIEEAPSPDER